MSKSAAKKPTLKKPTNVPPNLPHHNFEEPYSDLLTAGEFDDPEDILALAIKITLDHGEKGAQQLAAIICDDTFEEYGNFYEDDLDFERVDKRLAARANAVYVLSAMPAHAESVMAQMLEQLDSLDELVVEALPAYFTCIGEPALRPLIDIVNDPEEEEDGRASAVNCLTEMAEYHPHLKQEIISVFELYLDRVEDEPTLNTQLVMGLLDIGSKDSVDIIFQSFRNCMIDPDLLSIDEAEAHLGFKADPPIDRNEILSHFGYFDAPDFEYDNLYDDEMEDSEAADGIPQVPFVADIKIGRNDPCGCGSGSKFKKCCGRVS